MDNRKPNRCAISSFDLVAVYLQGDSVGKEVIYCKQPTDYMPGADSNQGNISVGQWDCIAWQQALESIQYKGSGDLDLNTGKTPNNSSPNQSSKEGDMCRNKAHNGAEGRTQTGGPKPVLTSSKTDVEAGQLYMLGTNAEPNYKDQFYSPPQSPVSSSYSPLPSPLRDEEDIEMASAALRATAVDLILNLQSQTHTEPVTEEINTVGFAEPASKAADTPETLLVAVHSQHESNSKDIINLEDVHPVENATCEVMNHHDADSLRQYQEVVVAVLGNLKEYEYQREAASFIKRISRYPHPDWQRFRRSAR